MASQTGLSRRQILVGAGVVGAGILGGFAWLWRGPRPDPPVELGVTPAPAPMGPAVEKPIFEDRGKPPPKEELPIYEQHPGK